MPGPPDLQCPWSSYTPGVPEFCERRLCDWIVEPSNAWSNVAYLAVGLYILWLERGRRPRSALTAIGVSAILVGIGSFAFHATGTFVGQVLDVSAMYLFSGLAISFALKRYFSLGDAALVSMYVGLCGISSALLIAFGGTGIAMFTAQIAVACFLELRMYRYRRGTTDYRPLAAVVACFVVAFIVWTLDITHTVCDPDNHIFTGHAFWHIANSLCFVFFYLFQRQFSSVQQPSAA